jgi:hypothetical protein
MALRKTLNTDINQQSGRNPRRRHAECTTLTPKTPAETPSVKMSGKLEAWKQNQGDASIFPRQELTRHGDRHSSYPLFFSSWRTNGGDVELCLRSGILVWGLVWRDCDDVCGPLCLSMLPDVFKGAGGTMRLRKTHISGMSSLILRRASVTYSLNTLLTESFTKSQR